MKRGTAKFEAEIIRKKHLEKVSAQKVKEAKPGCRIKLGSTAIEIYWNYSGGNTKEVKGPGVVGEQPVLKPGEKFEYTSGTPLSTPSGFMHGYYEMVYVDGKKFDVEIPKFSLDSPHASNQIH